MDIGSILPFIMQQKNGGGTDMTAMINALTGARQNQSAETTGPNPNLAGLLAGLNGGAPDLNDPAALLSILNRGNQAEGGNPNLNLVSLLSTLGKSGNNKKKPHGLKPVKAFVPDEILGKLVKYFSK